MSQATKQPAPSAPAISRILAAAGFERSTVRSRSNRGDTRTAGFRVLAGAPGTEVLIVWVHDGLQVAIYRTAEQRAQDLATAREIAPKYAETITAAGWPAEVTGDGDVRVLPKAVTG